MRHLTSVSCRRVVMCEPRTRFFRLLHEFQTNHKSFVSMLEHQAVSVVVAVVAVAVAVICGVVVFYVVKC